MTQLTELYAMPSMSYKEKAGDTKWKDFFGIELEIEGSSHRDPFGSWTVHNDGSLRDGTEFVLYTPQGGALLEKAIKSFYDVNMQYTAGPRTSTHIHVNMRDASVDNLRSMIMVVYMLEDAIFNSVGESRKWSGYSVGLNEMELRRLRNIMSSNDQKTLYTSISPTRNQERYYGFNTASFRKHGTVEFRYFPGGPTKTELESWINLVSYIKIIGKKYTPEELTYRIQDEANLLSFLDDNFDKYWVQEFTRHDTLRSLMDKFNVVSALSNDPDDLVRRDDLVFVNPAFLSFVIKHVLKEEGCKYIEPIAKKLGVTSVGEWLYYLEEARRRDQSKKSNKGSPLKVKAQEEEDYRPPDPFNAELPDWAQPVVEVEPRGVRHGGELFENLVAAAEGINPPPVVPRPGRVHGERYRAYVVNPVDQAVARRPAQPDITSRYQELMAQELERRRVANALREQNERRREARNRRG